MLKPRFKKLIIDLSNSRDFDLEHLRTLAELEFTDLTDDDIKNLVLDTLTDVVEQRLLVPGTMDPQNRNWTAVSLTSGEIRTWAESDWDFLTGNARDHERLWFRRLKL